jgi:hypothetical protein
MLKLQRKGSVVNKPQLIALILFGGGGSADDLNFFIYLKSKVD